MVRALAIRIDRPRGQGADKDQPKGHHLGGATSHRETNCQRQGAHGQSVNGHRIDEHMDIVRLLKILDHWSAHVGLAASCHWKGSRSRRKAVISLPNSKTPK